LPGEARPSDFDLLTAWAAGDADAAGRLIKRHTGALYRFFDRKVDGAVEDMVQETFVACVERVGHIRPEVGFRAYMFGVARHVLCARLRAQHRQPGELDLESSSLREVGPTPSELVVDAQEEKLLQEALRWLPVETQLLLELYYWQDLTANDLASIYGAAVPAIRSRLRRAKDALRDAVARVAQSPDLLRSTLAELERREPPPPPGA
jgi:RNA polymerase sigma factor (sigma-70 family)